MATDSTAFQHLWLLLENSRPVAVHSHLIGIAGSAKSAVFLSQLVYWTRRSPTALSAPGWIHKTSSQWFRELGLSRREQEPARAALKGLDVLEEALCGQPAMRYYRLRLPQLGNLLSVRLGLQLSRRGSELTVGRRSLGARSARPRPALPPHPRLPHGQRECGAAADAGDLSAPPPPARAGMVPLLPPRHGARPRAYALGTGHRSQVPARQVLRRGTPGASSDAALCDERCRRRSPVRCAGWHRSKPLARIRKRPCGEAPTRLAELPPIGRRRSAKQIPGIPDNLPARKPPLSLAENHLSAWRKTFPPIVG